MDKKNHQDYQTLVEFWNQSYNFEVEKEEQPSFNPDLDYLTLAPAQKLLQAAASLGKKQRVLDYGSGSGWASVIIAKSGGKNITSVEVIPNGYKATNYYAKMFKVTEQIYPLQIDEHWLENQESASFDGIFCSNVVDVVPLEMAENIVANLGRLLTIDGSAIISLNYYMDPQRVKERGLKSKDNHIYINNVLRLLSLSDEEWIAILGKYFEIEKLEYFAWPGENKETRRLFYLKKKINA